MSIQINPYISALQETQKAPVSKTQEKSEAGRFGALLEEKQKQLDTQTVRFSKHAANRLSERNISLSEGQLKRLSEGMDKASGKGIKEPLVLIDNLAFIVSTGSRTVITATSQDQTQENIFTNIDGTEIN